MSSDIYPIGRGANTVTDPTTVNQTATALNTTIDEALKVAVTTAETTIETALDEAVPFFALPVIKQITDGIIDLAVGELGHELSIALQHAGTFIVIDTQVGQEKTGISSALASLMIAEKSGDSHAIQIAIQAYADAQSALVRDDGSAPAGS